MKVPVDIGHGDVLIAAITSCTNTSNPSVMLAAGIVARKRGKASRVRPEVKTSLAPGRAWSRATWKRRAFSPTWTSLASHGGLRSARTCIGNSGPLEPHVRALGEQARSDRRQRALRQPHFEARVHQSIKANS